MKKITIAFSIFIFSQTLYSQTWFDIGLKGGYGPDFLANNNFYSDRYFSPKLSFGYMYGGKIGINFNEKHSVTIDVTSSSFDQSFNYSLINADSSRTQYKRNLGFNAINVLLMYRKTANVSYFEIGPQYSMLTQTRFSDNSALAKDADISSNLVTSYYAIAVGFGGFMAGTENFRVVLGFRFSYALNDIISGKGQQIDFPSITKYDVYKTSNPLTAMMVMELNLDLGYFTKSKCKRKGMHFLLF